MKPNIAIFSPLNPIKSGISDYTESLLPELKKYFNIDIYIDKNYTPNNKKIIKEFKIIKSNLNNFNSKKYSAIIYNIGSNECHSYMIEFMKKYKGITILHDYSLRNLNFNLFKEKRNFKNKKNFLNQQKENLIILKDFYNFSKKYYKKDALKATTEIIKEYLTKLNFPLTKKMNPIKYPFNENILEQSDTIIVHSNFTKNKINKKQVYKINHIDYSDLKMNNQKEKILKNLNLDKNTTIIISCGFVNPTKNYKSTIKSLLKLDEKFVYIIIGEDKSKILKKYKNNEKIKIIGYKNIKEIEKYISSADICINLRNPTRGETSGILIRMMSKGKPTIVTNHGWYSELPKNSVIKIPKLNNDEKIQQIIKKLIHNKKLRNKIGNNAKRFINTNCNKKKIGLEYKKIIEKYIKN